MVPIEKQVVLSRNTDLRPCEGEGEVDPDLSSYGECVEEWARRAYMEADCQQSEKSISSVFFFFSSLNCNHDAVCWTPQSLYLTSSLGLPPCLTDADTACMTDHLALNVINWIDLPQFTGCTYPCREEAYKTRQDYHMNGNFTFN